MSKSNLNLARLLKVASEVIATENFRDDLCIIKPSAKKSNIWKKIAESYFDNNDKKKDLVNIYSWWNRNTQNFRSLLTENISNTSISALKLGE